jgi:hypothetical protein
MNGRGAKTSGAACGARKDDHELTRMGENAGSSRSRSVREKAGKGAEIVRKKVLSSDDASNSVTRSAHRYAVLIDA